MFILKLLSGFYIIVFLLILFAGSFKRIKVDRSFYVMSFIFALCVGVWGFSLEPSVDLDLYRLQKRVRLLKFGSGSFFSKIWGASGMIGRDSTQGMIGWNLLCYVVQGMGNVHLLSAIGSFFTFFNVLYILVDYTRLEAKTSKLLGIGLLLAFMGLPIQYVFSGIRNALAVSLVMLALYLIFYKKKAFVFSIVLIFLAATIHPAALFALMPVIFARFRKQMLVRGIVLFTLPFAFMIANILAGTSIPILSTVLNRVLFYSNVQYQYDRPEMIANIAVFVSIGSVYWLYKREGQITEDSKLQTYYVNAYYILGIMMIGCAVHRDFTLRIGYIMGIAAIPIISKIILCPKKNKMDSIVYVSLILAILVCCGKVYYDTFLGLSQWNFG